MHNTFFRGSDESTQNITSNENSRLQRGDLWGHVPRRTGLAGHVVLDRPAPDRPVDDFCEAEVHELGRAAGGEADVVGLQVAVHQNALRTRS